MVLPYPGISVLDMSDERNVLLCTDVSHFLRPDGGLDFADMSLSQIEHAEARLADAAADAQRKGTFGKAAMEVELESGFLTLCGQLA